MSFLSQERLYLKPFSLSFVKEANGLLVTEKQLCYLTAWNGTERLQRLPTVKKFTLTSWGEGWTLPVESEVSGRTCAICRFAKPKGVQSLLLLWPPPSAEHPSSFQEGITKGDDGSRGRDGDFSWFILTSQCVGCCVWGEWLTRLFMTLGPGFTSVPKLATKPWTPTE